MSGGLRVLIVGGYGTFGGRIVDLLRDEQRLQLIVAGRSLGSARAFCARGASAATLLPAHFDRDGDLAAQLAALEPDVAVDASGPFQAYGARPYRLVEACIAARVNYLDLADGADFVAGVAGFDDAARAAGIHVLSGVSSFPVLTAAAVRRLAEGLSRVDAISGGIAPSPYAGVGENVIRAIASYAGQRARLRRNGADATAHPFTEQRRHVVAPPGATPLRSTLFSLVDVPDLIALAQLRPEAREIWMGAGPVPEILHRTLIGLAWLVRLRLAPPLTPLAPLMHWATNNLRWGEHRGGMFVEIEGVRGDGAAVTRSWHMLAEADDGPLIPSMAVEALLRAALEGHTPQPGARAALRELELGDYEALFARRRIVCGVRSELPDDAPLYRRVLGSAYDALPAPMREMHDGADGAVAEGEAIVARGRGLLAQAIGAAIGFPAAGAAVPVRVEFSADRGKEVWRRSFAGNSFTSEQSEGAGRSAHLLRERFGPLRFDMALAVEGECMRLVLRRWSAFGVPLPLWLAPRVKASESAEAGLFRFSVELAHRLAGPIVSYAGWLRRAAPQR